MRQTLLMAPHQIEVATDFPEPTVEKPTDAVVRVTAACICGSDLWPYNGAPGRVPPPPEGRPIGHEAVGVVTEVGAAVSSLAPGDFVIVPFNPCCNACPSCLAGFPSGCLHKEPLSGAQAEYLRVPLADGSLVKVPPADGGGEYDEALLASLLALSDVMATGWHAAVRAQVQPGHTAVVVGDGAVGLCGVIAAKQLGASRIIAMSRHETRQRLATEFGATDVVPERGDEGAAKVMELTDGTGADAVLECVGTGAAVDLALKSARTGATIGAVGVPQEDFQLPYGWMMPRNIGYAPGVASVRTYLPRLLDLVLSGAIHPGKVFDSVLSLDDAAEGYREMAGRTATKVMLKP